MVGAIVTASEMQSNFEKYIDMIINGSEIIVTKNGKEIGRFIPRDTAVSFLTDSLSGILKGNFNLEQDSHNLTDSSPRSTPPL